MPTLTALRKQRGLTQLQVAHALGVSRPAVVHWEAGRSRPTPEHLDLLVQLYQVSPATLEASLDATRPAETPWPLCLTQESPHRSIAHFLAACPVWRPEVTLRRGMAPRFSVPALAAFLTWTGVALPCPRHGAPDCPLVTLQTLAAGAPPAS